MRCWPKKLPEPLMWEHWQQGSLEAALASQFHKLANCWRCASPDWQSLTQPPWTGAQASVQGLKSNYSNVFSECAKSDSSLAGIGRSPECLCPWGQAGNQRRNPSLVVPSIPVSQFHRQSSRFYRFCREAHFGIILAKQARKPRSYASSKLRPTYLLTYSQG